ncbi:MAG: right-handed parallel beta-helix repeat-containing protein [Promethearchaeota archaeon]
MGLGAFTIINFQVIEGPQGIPGEDGQDAPDAPGGLVIGILDPDYKEEVSGNILVRALIYGSENYTVSILRNGTEIGTSLPMMWNTALVADGWWNITIIVTDITTYEQNQDEVLVYVQNVEDSTNIYYCSSQSEIEDALDAIDTGYGTIVITENITLSSTINIDDGGYYIIRSIGPVFIDRNANYETFYITNLQSLILRDLIIDTSDISSSTVQGIRVDEENDNPVYIQNVQIHGGNGRGIRVDSRNVWIENCIIHDVNVGMFIGSAYCHILDNSISSCVRYGIIIASGFHTISGNVVHNIGSSDGIAYGIYIASSSNTISGNVVRDISSTNGITYGIFITSNFNTISGNVVHDISSTNGITYGIFLTESSSNTINDNVIYAISADNNSTGGIGLSSFCDYNTISGNLVYDISSSSGDAHGIMVGSSDLNSIISNSIHQIIGSDAYGISLTVSNWNTFTSNIISYTLASSLYYGIYGSGDDNVIVGNFLRNTGTGIAVSGVGNIIDHNVVV